MRWRSALIASLAVLAVAGCRSQHTDTGVVAETASGDVAMLPFGAVRFAADSYILEPAPAAQLRSASRIVAVKVASSGTLSSRARVWMWRGPLATDRIDITGELTLLGPGNGYRIAFRDFSTDLVQWAQDNATAGLILHPHDHGMALAVVPAVTSPFEVVIGAPGSTGFAVRLSQ